MSANPSTVAAKYQAGGLGSIRKWPNSFDHWDYVPLTDAMSIGSRLTRLTSIHDHNCSAKNLRLLMLFVFGFLAVCTVAAWKMPKWIARWGPENGNGSDFVCFLENWFARLVLWALYIACQRMFRTTPCPMVDISKYKRNNCVSCELAGVVPIDVYWHLCSTPVMQIHRWWSPR